MEIPTLIDLFNNINNNPTILDFTNNIYSLIGSYNICSYNNNDEIDKYFEDYSPDNFNLIIIINNKPIYFPQMKMYKKVLFLSTFEVKTFLQEYSFMFIERPSYTDSIYINEIYIIHIKSGFTGIITMPCIKYF